MPNKAATQPPSALDVYKLCWDIFALCKAVKTSDSLVTSATCEAIGAGLAYLCKNTSAVNAELVSDRVSAILSLNDDAPGTATNVIPFPLQPRMLALQGPAGGAHV